MLINFAIQSNKTLHAMVEQIKERFLSFVDKFSDDLNRDHLSLL